MQSLSGTEFLKQHPLEELKELSTFGALSAETIAWLLEEGRISQLDRGESLFKPGRRGDSFYVILDGSIAYYRPGKDQYAYIRDYKTGQQIGFSNTLALHDRVGMSIATTDAVILEIDYRLFNRLRLEFPSEFGLLMLNLARELARMIRAVDDVIVDVKTHGVITDDSGLR
jgi:CRP-like cAMP-binding protein